MQARILAATATAFIAALGVLPAAGASAPAAACAAPAPRA